jgi:DNA-binding NtrC family response regulator
VQAVISIPGEAGVERLLRIRSLPLKQGTRRVGWLLLLQAAGESGGDAPVLFHGMWARTPQMKRLFHLIEKAARDEVTVLVRGETGSGKELVARALHELSPRNKGPFRAINCAALPGNLLESELFGHVRGAFTGAHRDTPGHIQLAHKGTLFLDEVAELPLELQAKLLRVLETRTVIPVGAREPVPVDVRIISATHRALRRESEAGRFRADLMYRLRVIPIFLPALRERRADIGLLVEHLIEEMNEGPRRSIESIAPAALRALESYDWPGNVRELRNVLSYAYVIGEGPVLELADLPAELSDPALLPSEEVAPEPTAPPSNDADPETQRIVRALERARGNRDQAAKLLGMSRVTLWRRMRELGLRTARKAHLV